MNYLARFCALVLFAIATIAAPGLAAPADPLTLMNAQNVPGMEVVVVDHGKVVTNAAYGVKNVTTKAPVDVHTRFEIGSITKQFTAAAILQLKERGKLSLDDRLGKYVPQYAPGKDVTIRQLLWQISGIPNYTDTPAFGREMALRHGAVVFLHPGNFRAILAIIAHTPLHFAPGTKWEYSNSNYVLLGRIVEITSGMSWETYVAKNIFARADMRESSFMIDEPRTADVATGYRPARGAFVPAQTGDGWAASAGAIVSTASDLARWDTSLFGGHIVAPADVTLMTSPGTLPAPAGDLRYGFGWIIDAYDGQPRVWHNGGTNGFNASNHVYPGLAQNIIVLTNSGVAKAASIAQAVFDGLHPDIVAAQSAASAGEDPAITARAKAAWQGFMTGVFDRSQLSASMNAAMMPTVLASAKAQFTTLGDATSWTYKGRTSDPNAVSTYQYRVLFSTGTALNIFMSIDGMGKLSAYYARPV